MGFYAPAQLVRDAKEHGVEVRPADVNHSHWDNSLESDGNGYRALRLGLRQIKGFPEDDANRLIEARDRAFSDPADIHTRARLTAATLERLAKADAYGSTGLSRREALWAVRALPPDPLPLFANGENRADPEVSLPTMAIGEEVTHDYATLRLSLKTHPLALLRKEMAEARVIPAEQLLRTKDGTRVTVAGIALVRSAPARPAALFSLRWKTKPGLPTWSCGRKSSNVTAGW